MLLLRELQLRFAAGLRGEAHALDGLVQERGFSAAERLNVYRNNYLISLTSALGDVYPVVKRLVGDGFFSFLANRFLSEYPSRSGNLHDFGAELPGFVAADESLTELPYLRDVAMLEWRWHIAFHAADADALEFADLAAIPPEQHESLVFDLLPGAFLMTSAYPVSEIWIANQADADADATVDLGAGGEELLIARLAGQVQVVPLPPGDFAMLASIADGQPFAQACAAGLQADPELDLGATLSAFIANNFLSGVLPGVSDS